MSAAAHRFNNGLRYRDGDHEGQTHLTPGYVLDLVREDLGGAIGLDPCTPDANPVGAETWYSPPANGLDLPWQQLSRWVHPVWLPSVFCNPPYGKAREPWVEKCIAAGAVGQRVVLLIPAATDTRIWQRAIENADAVVFVKGRLKFGTLRPNRRQHAASHPSSLIGWNTNLRACSALGSRVAVAAAAAPENQT